MQLNPKNAITIFLSVRKGLEHCLINEIRSLPNINNIKKIKYKRCVSEPDDTSTLNGNIKYPTVILPTEEATSWPKTYSYNYISNPKVLSTVLNPCRTIVKESDSCILQVQSGGIEIKCNYEWLLNSLTLLKSVESIWFRIGNDFRCHSENELIDRIAQLPWIGIIDFSKLDTLPLRIISRNSKLWSSNLIAKCIRLGLSKFAGMHEKSMAPIHHLPCVSITLNRNTCFVAFQYSGSMSPRPFNYINQNNYYGDLDVTLKNEVVESHWSLSQTRLQVHLQRSNESAINSVKINNNYDITGQSHSIYNTRLKYIVRQISLTRDTLDISDALIGGFLHSKRLYRKLMSPKLQIWNPFCSNGSLITEFISLYCRLPNFTLDMLNNSGISFLYSNCNFLKTLLSDKFLGYTPNIELEIIGSDNNEIHLREANLKLTKLLDCYEDIIKRGNNEYKPAKLPGFYKDYSPRLPFEVSLHLTKPNMISQYLHEALVIAKIPYIKMVRDDRKCHEVMKLYKEFGDVIVSKCDWKGVYVICRTRAFEFYSGLIWEPIVTCKTSKGSIIKLLRWSGKIRKSTSVYDRIDQMDSIDF